MIKNAFKWVGWVLSYPFVIIGLLFNLWGVKRKAKKYIRNPRELFLSDRLQAVYKLIKKVLYLKRVEVVAEDFDKLPAKQMLFIPNHKSLFDPMALYVALYESGKMGPTSFVAKAELFEKWYSKWALKLMDGVAIKRDDGRSILECYNRQNELIKNGGSIIVYPEGTRVPGDQFGEFKPTTLKVAYENFVTIEPIAIYGADLENNPSKGYKRKVYVSALKPIQPNNFITTNKEQLMPSIQQSIENKYIELKAKALMNK